MLLMLLWNGKMAIADFTSRPGMGLAKTPGG
jgi:hypothetical protein